jgi:predicted ArsR family transcriptional regulator
MTSTRWDKRFFRTTRGRVVALLRRSSRTVEDLARELTLTDNAIRSHLAALERDGIVVQQGFRRGVGKPAHTYALSPEAERLFPKAYELVLGEFLDALAQRMPREELERLARDVGRCLAASRASAATDRDARLRAAVRVLNELGGLAEIEEVEGRAVIRGYSCPLGAVAPRHPEACLLAEALLQEVIGERVRERCDHERPACRFEVGAEAEKP